MIKYLGSKRRLVPVLGELAERSGAAHRARPLHGHDARGPGVQAPRRARPAVDSARYAEALARCYVATDGRAVDRARAARRAGPTSTPCPATTGYVTETFCRASPAIFQPHNGARIDAIRDALARDYAGSPLYPILLTSLLEAADRVDSTTGVQMAYLKEWAPRSHTRPRAARARAARPAPGAAVRGDALALRRRLPEVDLAYLDPPYNQHSYYRNYHVWETLVAWDAPEHYGVACKRDRLPRPGDAQPRSTPAPPFRDALAGVVRDVRARVLVLSYNDESWIELDDLVELCAAARRGAHAGLRLQALRRRADRHPRPGRQRVGRVGRLRNVEYLLVAGDAGDVAAVAGRGARLAA